MDQTTSSQPLEIVINEPKALKLKAKPLWIHQMNEDYELPRNAASPAKLGVARRRYVELKVAL
ncbi:hypothetical protein CXK96_15560 [Stutzerimonas stutzeri]|nr:hypothetical protein CXK96_15560 [Stutzerimonas stutzeri]